MKERRGNVLLLFLFAGIAMKVRILILSVLACLVLQSFLIGFGRLRRGFEALDIYNYFKAKELFYKEIDKNRAGATYGLSIIHGRDDNPFYRPDSAYVLILISDSSYSQLDDRDREKLAELQVDSTAIASQKRYLDSLLYSIAEDKKGIDVIDEYLHKTVNSHLRDTAVRERNKRAFQKANETDDSEAYLKFMNEYPDAAQVNKAERLYQKRLFQEETRAGTLEAYSNFVDNHPSSPYREEAEYEIYKKMTAQGTLGQLKAFVKAYPENRYTENAWRQIYALEVPDFDPKSIAAFTLKYPNYPFLDEIQEDFQFSVTTYYSYTSNDQWGFIDEKGNVRIQAKYDWCEPFFNGMAMVGLNNKVGFVNKRGEEIIEIQYADASNFREGYAAVKSGSWWGFMDRTGNWLVEPEFSEVGDFNEGMAYVEKDGLFGYVNDSGKLVIPVSYSDATDYRRGTAVVEKNGMQGIIDTLNNVLSDFQWDWTESFNEHGIARVRLDDRFGLISRGLKDSLLIPVDYEALGDYNEGRALLAKEGKYGFVDTTGKEVIPMKYDFNQEALSRSKFENGFAWVNQEGKVGVIDTSGEKVYPCIFEDVGEYSGKLVPVKRRGKWGYADKEVELVIPYDYQYATSFNMHMARVMAEEKWGVIDTTGEYLIQPSYNQIDHLDSSRFLVEDTLWGVVDSAGQVVVPFRYEEAEVIDDRTIRFTRSGSFDYYHFRRNRFIWKEE